MFIFKKISFLQLLFVSCSLSLLLATPLHAATQEQIDNFNVQLKINPDASLQVKEKIEYNFGSHLKHGIYRYLPIKYKARGGNYKLRVSAVQVTDQNGRPYHFKKSFSHNNLELKIGQADKMVSGIKTYIISYRLQRVINYFANHDELYWNVTGNDWPVVIQQATAEIILPHASGQITHDCFAGRVGSQQKCAQQVLVGQQVLFNQSNLTPGQGLTVVVGWPKGWVAEPTWWQKILATVYDNWVLVLPLLTLLFMGNLWWRHGRDARGHSTIIAEYDAPDGLSPAQVGTLIDEKVDRKDISAEIIYLAVQGYLKIRRLEKKITFIKQTDYELIKLKPIDQNLNSFQHRLLSSFFSSGRQTVKLSELKNNFYQDLVEIKKLIYKSLSVKKYFTGNPQKIRSVYTVIGIAIIFLGQFLGSFFGGLGVVSLAICGLVVLVFGLLMPAKTKAGVLAKQHILGLKEYLTVAEKDRLNFHNAPEKNPSHFEKLLPYAIVLKVEKKWARQFKDIYRQPPSWYEGPSSAVFNSMLLVSSLDNFRSSADNTLSFRSSSAAAGGSGFSSGGVGGGFGGGGGGSW